MNPLDKLKELNITLPEAPSPVGAYVAFKKINNFLYISGQLPINKDGKIIKDEKIIVLPPESQSKSPNKTKVYIEIITSSKRYPGVYSMYLDRNNEWKIINIVVNGINLGLTFRSQFYSLMENNNKKLICLLQN